MVIGLVCSCFLYHPPLDCFRMFPPTELLMKLAHAALLTSIVILLFGGCKKDDEAATAPAAPLVYRGTFADGTESGVLTLTIGGLVASGGDTATGTLQQLLPSPATVALAGALKNDSLLIRGGAFRLSGTASGVRLTGTFTGPFGVGGFATQLSINNAGTSYCGTYTSQVAGGENGTFNLVITGTTVSGVAVSATGANLTLLEGSVVGNTINIPNVAAGAINGATAAGSFTFGTNRGIWSATVCQ
jgi:hypothetical protein